MTVWEGRLAIRVQARAGAAVQGKLGSSERDTGRKGCVTDELLEEARPAQPAVHTLSCIEPEHVSGHEIHAQRLPCPQGLLSPAIRPLLQAAAGMLPLITSGTVRAPIR